MKRPLTALVLLGAALTLHGYDETTQSHFPRPTPPRSLLVAKTWADGQSAPIVQNSNPRAAAADLILLESLAGLLLKQGSPEGLFIEPNASHRFVLQDLSRRRGIPYTYYPAPLTTWDLASHFRAQFGGRYVLCNLTANPDSLNLARMAAYRFDAVIVDSVIQSSAVARQWTNVFDATAKNDQWFFTNWWPAWPVKGLAVEQNNDPALAGDYALLNDYAAATGAPAFFDGTTTPLRLAFLQGLEPDSVLIGWPHADELTFTEANSRKNVSLVAANYCFNLALLSSLREPDRLPLTQALCPNPPPLETNVHYATFIFSDGDNVQWMHNNFLLNTQWWGSPIRGRIPLGWGLSPTLRDLSPTIAEYLLESAATTRPANDTFVAMSPIGYCYPSLYSDAARATNAVRLARYMRDLDLHQLVILDKYAFESPAVYLPYLQQPQIDAIFSWDAFGNYARYAGAIQWQNGKPIIAAFTNLWGTTGPAEVAAALNARPRNPRSPGGYSMVDVHAWTHGVESVSRCVQLLDPQVRVVTPDVFVSQLRRAIGPENRRSTADLDLGNAQLAAYRSPSSATMTVAPNRTSPSVDGSPSTSVQVGSTYAFCNLALPAPLTLDPTQTLLEFDLRGDNSGARIRFELWSDPHQAFLYVDLVLDFNGWRHFAYRLDGSDGLQAWNATPAQVSSALTIWQVSGPWNGKPAGFHLDNVRLTVEQAQAARPRLTFLPVGQQWRVSWSSAFADFQLQTLDALGGLWQPLSSPVLNTNCECSLWLAPTNTQRFFRLCRS